MGMVYGLPVVKAILICFAIIVMVLFDIAKFPISNSRFCGRSPNGSSHVGDFLFSSFDQNDDQGGHSHNGCNTGQERGHHCPAFRGLSIAAAVHGITARRLSIAYLLL